MRRDEPEQRTARMLTWAFGVATVPLGMIGFFADRKTPLVLCMLCAGLACLSFIFYEVLTGRRMDWSGFFGYRLLSLFAFSGILTIYALLILLGLVDFTLDEAKDFVRFWKRR